VRRPASPPDGFRDAGAYEGGEFGARRVVDDEGRAYVYKQQPPGLAPQTTEALRAVGYPAPRYIAWGEDWHLQEELPGTPDRGWGAPGPAVLAQLLELNELQGGRAVDDDRSWPASITESVTLGMPEYAQVGILGRHSDASRELLALCRRAVERYADSLQTRDDVVHWDFTRDNVLVDGDRLTGVIDWGGTRSGDRLFDLATLVYYARGEMPEVERYVVERIGRGGLAVYLSHIIVRQTDWSLRFHGLDTGEQVLTYGLELARAFP
jgi:hypothetical protein